MILFWKKFIYWSVKMRCCGNKYVDSAGLGDFRAQIVLKIKLSVKTLWLAYMKDASSRSWAPDPSEDVNPRVTRDARNSRDQSYIFSFYLPFLGLLWWVRLYLCSQESFANDVSTGCLSYFCILGEYVHRKPFLRLYFGWVLAQDTFSAPVYWVDMSTGYLSYFCMLVEHKVPFFTSVF